MNTGIKVLPLQHDDPTLIESEITDWAQGQKVRILSFALAPDATSDFPTATITYEDLDSSQARRAALQCLRHWLKTWLHLPFVQLGWCCLGALLGLALGAGGYGLMLWGSDGEVSPFGALLGFVVCGGGAAFGGGISALIVVWLLRRFL